DVRARHRPPRLDDAHPDRRRGPRRARLPPPPRPRRRATRRGTVAIRSGGLAFSRGPLTAARPGRAARAAGHWAIGDRASRQVHRIGPTSAFSFPRRTSVPSLPTRRAAVTIAAAALFAPLGTPGALAAAPAEIDLETVVTSLTENGGLYIDPGVKDFRDAQLDRLRGPLESANLPVYIAVFPAGAIPDRATAHNQLIVD